MTTYSYKTAFQAIQSFHSICQFSSIETKGEKASNSELKRWLNQGAIQVNGKPIGANDPWPYDIRSMIMFPKSPKRRCTLIWNPNVHIIEVDGNTLIGQE